MDVKAFLASLTTEAQDELWEYHRDALYAELRNELAGSHYDADREWANGVLQAYVDILGEPGGA